MDLTLLCRLTGRHLSQFKLSQLGVNALKFTDGFWLMRPGCIGHYAAQAYEIEVKKEALIVYAPTRQIRHRSDTLDIPMLTVCFSSPFENVIRVQVCHHKGTKVRPPFFELGQVPPPQVVVTETEDFAELKSGNLAVRVHKKGGWLVEFRDGEKVITKSGHRSLGFVYTPQGRFIHEQLSLSVGECVYGLGERFTAFVKNGQVVDMWNADAATTSDQAYKNIPFYLTNRGYGVFVNHPERVSFEVASEHIDKVQFSVPGEWLDYFVIYGPTPKEVLERYTALTGRPALPPAWSFGLWLTTSFTTSYDEKTVTSFIQGMADRDIPLSVFHFDCFWMREFQWCDFKWDERCFPDPVAMLKRLKERGLKICVWINPYIAQKSLLFDEAAKKGYLLKKPNGDIWQTDMWQAGMGIVDFTNPEARKWFAEKLQSLVDMGVDCFKTDFGERIPTEVVYHDGSDPERMHNFYAYLYNKTVFEALEEKRGKGETVLFARSATAGSQKFPVHWGGDCLATYESMAASLRAGLSLGLCGFGFWSHDIGGFIGTPTPDLYKRWCAFGLLSSHSRLHGNDSYRVPWLFDEEAVEVLRFFTKLKCRLMPYLYGIAREAHERGIPVMRAMVLEFPDDPACDYLDRQYMLGDALLVAPVFSPDGTVDYYLPSGRWTSFLTGQVIEGGRWLREKHNYLSLPLMVRPNSIVPVGAVDNRPDYDFPDGVKFQIFELQDGSCVGRTVPDLKGNPALTVKARREGRRIEVQVEGERKENWSVQLRNIPVVKSVENGVARPDPQGVVIVPEKGAERLTIELER